MADHGASDIGLDVGEGGAQNVAGLGHVLCMELRLKTGASLAAYVLAASPGFEVRLRRASERSERPVAPDFGGSSQGRHMPPQPRRASTSGPHLPYAGGTGVPPR